MVMISMKIMVIACKIAQKREFVFGKTTKLTKWLQCVTKMIDKYTKGR